LFHENIKHVSSLHESQKTMQEESEQWCSHQHAENDSHLKECEHVIRSIESSFEITSIASRDVTSMLDIRADEDADVSYEISIYFYLVVLVQYFFVIIF
jgi:hypothetical protein